MAAAGLGIAAVTAYRKRFLTATRIAAYALVPAGLVLTGAVAWIARTAFSPSAWAGFGVLGLAWLLFMTTRTVERRRGTRKERAAAAPEAVTGGGRPAVGGSTGAGKASQAPAAGKKQAGGDDDFSDIEAILKKHGI
ncbi:membrane protein [Streptomyces sp. FR-008]|nr:membrane protein [Streptomyces sp. FR-008]